MECLQLCTNTIYGSHVPVNGSVLTGTDGHWLRITEPKNLSILGVYAMLMDIGDGEKIAELRVYFDLKSWSTVDHGLIYGDDMFKGNFLKLVAGSGVTTQNIEYSEHGMQGMDYVSFDLDLDSDMLERLSRTAGDYRWAPVMEREF